MQLFFSALFASLLLVGCVQQQTPSNASEAPFQQAPAQDLAKTRVVKAVDSIKADYVGSLENGTVFDTSLQAEAEKAKLPPRPTYEPLEFVVGSGALIEGFDKGVLGMRVGEEKTVRIPAEQAYGARREELVLSVNRTLFGNESSELKVGAQIGSPAGVGTITALNGTHATVDFNHPLAGKTLVFKIILREIKP